MNKVSMRAQHTMQSGIPLRWRSIHPCRVSSPSSQWKMCVWCCVRTCLVCVCNNHIAKRLGGQRSVERCCLMLDQWVQRAVVVYEELLLPDAGSVSAESRGGGGRSRAAGHHWCKLVWKCSCCRTRGNGIIKNVSGAVSIAYIVDLPAAQIP